MHILRKTKATYPLGGFTMVELLVVTVILGILVALGVGVAQRSMNSAAKALEINAARQLIAAFQATAIDGGGQYLPGMDMRVNTTTNPVYNNEGKKITNIRAAQRYPFRLAPYLGNHFDGTILINKNVNQILESKGDSDYLVSTYPALGMNIYAVGGVMQKDGTTLYEADCITTPARMQGSILAFASAGQGKGNKKMDGYSYVTPPTLENDSPLCKPWSSTEAWSADADPMDYGYVDFRYNGQAICAFLDGSVRMLSVGELNDMRIWNPNASDLDERDYQIAN